MTEKRDIASLTTTQLADAVKEMGLPAFRAAQIFDWLHKKQAVSFSEMTNLPLSMREALNENWYIPQVTLLQVLRSKVDNTVKYLYGLGDGNRVEGVCMEHHHGSSLCISTQVGCAMGCSFCASTLGGRVRNLTASEMLHEIYAVEKSRGKPVDSLVLMGMGEPLDNFEQVMLFLELLCCPAGRNMSLRHVSLSTCGLVDKIYALAERKLQLTLSVSLHAPTDEIRDAMMPVNRRFRVDEVLTACRDYFAATGRRVSFEYALVHGVNDKAEHARLLAEKLRGTGSHVNLIPVNTVEETDCKRSTPRAIAQFQKILTDNGVNATIRREHGSDINAACGQLRQRSLETD